MCYFRSHKTRHFKWYCTNNGTDRWGYGLVSNGSGILSQGVKQSAHETNHWPASGAKFTKAWNYVSTVPYVFMVWCIIRHWNSFTFIAISNKMQGNLRCSHSVFVVSKCYIFTGLLHKWVEQKQLMTQTWGLH